MSISLDILRTFVTFASSQNIFEAAKKLGISQPSVTVQLKRVEDFFGVQLFTLNGKKKVLNNHGKVLYNATKAQIDSLDFTVNTTKRSFLTLSETALKVASRRELFPMLISMNVFPGKINFISASSQEATELLLCHQVDFAISHVKPDSLDVVAKEIFTVGTHFLIHRSMVKTPISMDLFKRADFLVKNPLITYNNQLPHITIWLDHYKIPHHNLFVKMTVDDWNIVTGMVSEGKGYTLCPDSFASDDPDVLKFPVNRKIVPPVKFYLLQKKDTKNIFPANKVFKNSLGPRN